MERQEFLKIINTLAEVYDTSLSEVKLDLYFECLKDCDYKALQSAVISLLKTRVYPSMPKPSELLDFIGGKLEDRALLAWDTARWGISSHGYYKTVSFRDKIINGVIQAMGGWEQFSSMLIEEEPFRQKDFIKLYEVISRSRRNCPEKLIGYHERNNKIQEKIIYIGKEDELVKTIGKKNGTS